MKIMVRLGLTALAAYALLVTFIYTQQRDIMFLPSTDRLQPVDVSIFLSDVKEVTLETRDGQNLYSWYAQAMTRRPTILFFHGNAGSVPLRHLRMQGWMSKGYGVLMLGYPGYGGSEGEPSENGFAEAAQLAYDFLRDEGLSAEQVVIYGQSIGTGVAVTLASENPAKALILEAPMMSAKAVAQQHYPYLPVSLMLKDPFLSMDRIDKIGMPLLIIHGDQDQIIPVAHGRALYEKAVTPKTFHPMQGAGHNDLSAFPVLKVTEEYLLTL